MSVRGFGGSFFVWGCVVCLVFVVCWSLCLGLCRVSLLGVVVFVGVCDWGFVVCWSLCLGLCCLLASVFGLCCVLVSLVGVLWCVCAWGCVVCWRP